MEWEQPPSTSYTVTVLKNGQTYDLSIEGNQLRQAISPQSGFDQIQLHLKKGNTLASVRVYSNGTLPSEVQNWAPTVDKAELMVIAAHPDDDILWMGGTLPYYAGQLKKDTVVLYMSHQKRLRQSEALDGLWTMGVRTYPVFAGFPDKYLIKSIEEAEEKWGGREKVVSYLVEQIRKYQPDVIVTHDVNGEYGHGHHKLVAACIQEAVLAAKTEQYPESFEAYGSYEVKKLYLHLYDQNRITMDWRAPLSAFDGKTALEVAILAYQAHKSQQQYAFRVQDTGKTSCKEFGLAYTSVGADVQGGDFFENIAPVQVAQTPSPKPTPTMTPTLSPVEQTPAVSQQSSQTETLHLVIWIVAGGTGLLLLALAINAIVFFRRQK